LQDLSFLKLSLIFYNHNPFSILRHSLFFPSHFLAQSALFIALPPISLIFSEKFYDLKALFLPALNCPQIPISLHPTFLKHSFPRLELLARTTLG
jgi:hypothetical protein